MAKGVGDSWLSRKRRRHLAGQEGRWQLGGQAG